MFLHNFGGYHAPEDGDGSGNGGGTDASKGGDLSDNKDGKGDDLKATVGMLTQAVTLLGKGLEEIKANNGDLGKAIEALKPKEPEAKPITPESLLDGVDLTEMDNAQLANLIITKATTLAEAKVKEAMAGYTKATDDKVNSLAETVHSKNAAEAIAAISKDNPDFFEWKPEIAAIFRQHPTLTIAEAFTLAKNSNPAKVAEMTKKYVKPTEKKIFSFAPGGVRSEGGGKMSQGAAAEAAFNAVFGQAEHLLNSDTKVF